MILGIIPLLCYTIAWPLVIMVAFYNASRRHLFHDKDFKGIFGFIYMVAPHTDFLNDCRCSLSAIAPDPFCLAALRDPVLLLVLCNNLPKVHYSFHSKFPFR